MPDLVWNELSITDFLDPAEPPWAQNIPQARAFMERLVDVMRTWARAGQPRVIRIPTSLVNLAPGYSLDQWRNDSRADRDQRQLFRLYASRRPELADVLDAIRDRADVSEMLCEGRVTQGLLAAWLTDGVAVSWDTHPLWRRSAISCVLRELGPVDDLLERRVEVWHASRPEQIESWLATRVSEREQHLLDGPSVLQFAAEWLPALRFVGSALNQLPNWAPNRQGWPFVLRSICQLQDICTSWGDHPFPHDRLSSPCTPEASRVDDNADLRSAREFTCEDGERRYFTWHIKHYKLNLRIHYDPDDRVRIVRIAHIGGHLPL
jgi:hypothetical protein